MSELDSSAKTISNPPDPARIMDGLRDTGYDFNTAVSDIIDNSIAADATEIYVRVEADPNMNVTVTIADNGIGMDYDGLKNAMKYGSDKRPDAKSLGKFGLGLKTASTAFCKKLSVVSRPAAGADALKVCWDLDFISKMNDWSLLVPEATDDDLDLLDQAAKGDSGTVVIWENIDRLFRRSYSSPAFARKALDKFISGLRDHIELVYQRFLDRRFSDVQDVRIWLNDEEVKPFDPFCTDEDKTALLQNCILEIEGTSASLEVKAYLLPRKDEFSTKEAAARSRLGNDTQGFYVYRENRLIYFGNWMGMFKNEPHFSLLRVEVSFNHIADDYLNVDIKKSRILFDQSIYDILQKEFLPAPRREAEKRYRQGTTAAVNKTGKAPHDAANKTIESKAPHAESSKTTILDESNNQVRVENKNGSVVTRIKIRGSEDGAMRVIPVESIEYNALWNPVIADGRHAVELNMSHPYYQKVYYPLLGRPTSITGLDALFWSLAEAELGSFTQDSKEFFEDMRLGTSRNLSKLIADLPDPDVPDEDLEA